MMLLLHSCPRVNNASGSAATQCGEACLTVRSNPGLEASPPFGGRRSLAWKNQRAWPVRHSLTALGSGKAAKSLPPSTNRSRHNFIVAQLRSFIPTGNQDLRARMIQRHQQASIPATNLCGIISQREFMIVNQLQRLKRHGSQTYDHVRIDQFNCPLQKFRAVSNFASGWPPIRAGCRPWIT
jgi:hypothetical protein